MRVLGCIIAGGQSRRFGSNKAAATLAGRPIIDHIIEAITPQVDAVLVQGQQWRDYATAADHPLPPRGPLSGLCAGLRYGAEQHYDWVLTAGCDTLPIPHDLLDQLAGQGPGVIDGQWLMGLWPASLADALQQHIVSQDDWSMKHWIAVSGARKIQCATQFRNVNTPDDLAALAALPARL